MHYYFTLTRALLRENTENIQEWLSLIYSFRKSETYSRDRSAKHYVSELSFLATCTSIFLPDCTLSLCLCYSLESSCIYYINIVHYITQLSYRERINQLSCSEVFTILSSQGTWQDSTSTLFEDKYSIAVCSGQ